MENQRRAKEEAPEGTTSNMAQIRIMTIRPVEAGERDAVRWRFLEE